MTTKKNLYRSVGGVKINRDVKGNKLWQHFRGQADWTIHGNSGSWKLLDLK